MKTIRMRFTPTQIKQANKLKRQVIRDRNMGKPCMLIAEPLVIEQEFIVAYIPYKYAKILSALGKEIRRQMDEEL